MMGLDESKHILARIQSGEDIILSPVQCFEMSINLYNDKDNRWVEPIEILMKILDECQCLDSNTGDFRGQMAFDVIEKYLKDSVEKRYKSGSYYKDLDDNKTLERMKKDGKIK